MLNKSYNLRCLFLVWLAFLAPALANAQDSAYLSDVGYSGTGCPLGTAGAVLSPDGTSVSVLFDDFIIDSSRECLLTLWGDRREFSMVRWMIYTR